MAEFMRARSPEQKEQRMSEIKEATDSLFAEQPYHAITLSTIADRLSWTRANLYRYVSTKEEVFLELTEDRMSSYYNALLSAVPRGCGYSDEVLAEVWSGILNAHSEYLRYGSVLLAIVENNVSVERLAAFKTTYYSFADEMASRLSEMTGMTEQEALNVQASVFSHGTGLMGACHTNPIMIEALKTIGRVNPPVDLREEMRTFILMNLGFYGKRRRFPQVLPASEFR